MGVSFAKLKHELMKMVPPTVFFFILLHAVVIIRALMVKGTGISLPTSVSVIVSSLILGKAVLIANMLPFINRYPDRPLIWKAILAVREEKIRAFKPRPYWEVYADFGVAAGKNDGVAG